MNTYAMTHQTAHRINWKALVISLVISVGTGMVSGLITSSSMQIYINEIAKPPLSPPGILFPIVWTILFVLMGISAYMVYMADVSPYRGRALGLYGVQLAFNFCWMLIFFNARNYVFAFIWLIAVWLLVFFMIRTMRLVKPLAGYLQIPYLVWLTFAGYLNFGIILLN